MGAGVPDNETFEKLIEHHSNLLLADALFAVPGPESFRGRSLCSSQLLQLGFELNRMRPSVAGQGNQADGSRRGMSEQTTMSICAVILASDGIRFVADAKVFYRQPGF